ncbi:CPBP family intramembrane glutamic endopeptidase [Catenuloplanes atrovinosus]|uniref:Membrane protease YdiL (CAAX protease family) n=1 Tax=Catenuloplanes atrovinosus TaxID=137266 RepID=A0AAE4C9F8_9ACTN|nr:CPBP family intramembrane glutamic endopeptidase [Catenuloplanes atrovinosus]MDR7276491.1 membrane protease YdiL (CAAX protease family) [Catenuloplanes atrovinosus]
MTPRVVLTAAGGALFVLAPLLLLLTGHTEIVTSSDEGAGGRPLWTAVVPALAGMALVRLLPPSRPSTVEAQPPDRAAIARQVRWLVGIAVAFPALVAIAGAQSLAYPLIKVALFLGGALLVTRLIRAGLPPAVPVRWFWVLPAIVGWGVLAFRVPADLTPYEDLDRVYLATAMTVTFLTASVLEEFFYRVTLQTRIEALAGRWPAIVATSLLFAAMHLPSHLGGDHPWVAVAGIVAFQGFFGLFTGYLWSRYRRFWPLVAVHGAVNALPLLPLFT